MKTYKMTAEEYREGVESYQGICLACGENKDTCEGDAQSYKCDVCGAFKVMGYEMALVCGHIELESDDDCD
jgi:hypothetical protein